MEAWEAKLIASAVLLVVIFIPAILPIKVAELFNQRGEVGRYQLSVFACFGSGVFMGTYLMHMVPEVDHLITSTLLEPHGIEYPIGELIIGSGFFILIVIDQMLHVAARTAERLGAKSRERNSSSADLKANQEKSVPSSPILPAKSRRAPDRAASSYTVNYGTTNEGFVDEDSQGVTPGGDAVKDSSLSSHEMAVNVGEKRASLQSSGDSFDEDTEAQKKAKLGAMKAVVLLVALSFDGIFSGLSCGLQTDVQAVWNLLVAICAHEAVIAFMLGLQLRRSYTPRVTFFMSGFYALTNPLGVLLGLALSLVLHDADQFDLLSGILQACCAGVFMYVSFVEILGNEYVNQATPLKTLSIILGFIFMALLALIPRHSLQEEPETATLKPPVASYALSDVLHP